MEALVAVGFAANILQFVDYICHVLNVGKQLRRRGMSDSNLDLERAAKILENQVVKIRSQQGTGTGLDETDKSLDKLAEECMTVAKQLIDFIAKFKIEKDLEPETITIPISRPKHQDEIELEKRIDSISLQIIALRQVISTREAEEKKIEQERLRQEKKNNDNEKARKEAERKSKAKFQRNLELEFKERIKRSSELLADEKLERSLNTTLNQKRAVGNAIKEKYGEKEPLERKPTKPAKRIPGPKHRDTIELERLKSLKQQTNEDLDKVANREDIFFRMEQTRLQNANDEAKKKSTIRRSIKTFTTAVKLEWNKTEIEALGEKLDRIRGQLSSEVMLNIHKSVKGIKESTRHSDQLLEDIYTLQTGHQLESLHAIQSNQLTVEKVSTQLHSLDEAASRRHDKVIDLISAFTDVLKDRFLFPALPEILTEVDPSLKPAAFDGYDAIENAVLAALYFRKMNIREAQVQEAYKNTFSWIFKDPKQHQERWSNFKWWLQNDSGCYWIAGKAGCGKSTLMKFLGSDIRTKTALEQWADSDELITATYFFWMAGTALQKNQEGLLRSLLHTILSRKRDLIARAFPREYNAMMTKIFADNTSPEIFFSCDNPGCSSSFDQPQQLEEHRREHHINEIQDSKHNQDSCGTLTLVELKRAFTTLARQNLKGFKICLFIDGLDEYVGDQKEILDLFKTITSNSAIKAVVSSRPEAIFEEAFRKSPKLRVEKLTSGDIKHYVKSKLFSHSRMESEMQESSELGARLVFSIVSKASGVFLWVFLVVRLLLDRLSKGEYPEALEAIIKTYPEELQELYKHMFFDRMEEAHKIEAFRLFQSIHFAQTIESEIPTALRLSFMDRDQPATSIYSPVKILQPEDLQERLSIFESRLKSRCCGLFEVHYYDQDETSHIQEGRVTLLHRTVSDFLDEPSLRQIIEGETLQFTTEIYERLCASILHSFKAWRFFHIKHPREWKKFCADIRAFLIYCQRCESKAGSNPIEYIKEFDQQLSHFWRVRAYETRSSAYGLALGSYQYHWAESFLGELRLKLSPEPDDDPLLSLAARYGLYTYACKKIETRLTSDANFLNTAGHSLVLRLSYWAMHDSSLRAQHFRIIESFLESGLRINAKSYGPATTLGRTPWQDLLALQSKNIPSQTNQLSTVIDIEDDNQTEASEVEILDTWTRLVEVFVKFGAELDVNFKPFKGAARSRTAREVILEIMATPVTEESLSSEESVVIENSKTRIEQLLSDKPITRLEDNAGTSPSSILAHHNSKICLQTNPMNDERPASSQSRQSRRLKSPQKIKHDGPAKSPPPIHTVTTSDGPCYRCKAVDKLTEIGCTPNEIFEALKTTRVGYDVQALLTWILDKKENRSMISTNTSNSPIATTRTRPPPPVTTSGTSREPAITGLVLTQSRDSASRQWKVVPNKNKAPIKRDDIQVVGAQWVSSGNSQKVRARRSKEEGTISEKNTLESEIHSSAGVIDGNGGTFTWFFESRSHPQHVATLSFEQRKQLEELVKSWKT